MLGRKLSGYLILGNVPSVNLNAVHQISTYDEHEAAEHGEMGKVVKPYANKGVIGRESLSEIP